MHAPGSLPVSLLLRTPTHREQNVEHQIDKDTGIWRVPVPDNGRLLHREIILGPREVRKHLHHLLVSTQLAGNELPKAERKGDGGDGQRDDSRVQESVLLQELVDPFIGSHKEDVLPVHEDIQGASESTEQSDQRKHKQLLWVKGKVHREVGGEHGSDCVRLLEPHSQQTENGRPTDGGKETAPVIAHSKVRGGYFDTEQDSWNQGQRDLCRCPLGDTRIDMRMT